VQISAGLELETLSDALRAFDDGVYLHQVVHRGDAGLTRYLDLPDAFAAGEPSAPSSGLYRVHFHVPLFARARCVSRTQRYLSRCWPSCAIAPSLAPRSETHVSVPRGVPARRHRGRGVAACRLGQMSAR
jgi:hypothetical protein